MPVFPLPRGGLAVLTTLLVIGDIALFIYRWTTAEPDPSGRQLDLSLTACSLTIVGVLVRRASPRNPVGWVLLGMGVAATIGALAGSRLVSEEVGRSVEYSTWWLAVGPLTVVLLLLPDGRLPSPRWRPVLVLAVAGVVLPEIGAVLVAVAVPEAIVSVVHNPLVTTSRGLTAVGFLMSVVVLSAGLYALVLRLRRSESAGRALLRWLLLLGAATPLGLLLELLEVPGGWAFQIVALPMVMLVAALRHRLLDMDLVIDRTIVWIGSTVVVLAAFYGLLWVVSTSVRGATPELATPVVVATVLTALIAAPVRTLVLRAVHRTLYGRRDDPAAALEAVDHRLEESEAGAVLQATAEAVATTLALPYVAVELEGERGARRTAVHGRPAGAVETIALVHRGHPLGTLSVTARSRSERLTQQERRVIELLGRTAAVTVRAVELADTLQAAREGLVHAREEERLRLRRDLHDGVGPALMGTRMHARAVLRAADDGTRPGLARIDQDLAACIEEMAQVVDGLRPPALDEGLATALRGLAARFGGPGLTITVDAGLPDLLPPAVEVCLYRITAEALSNVVRHARATRCELRLDRVGEGVALCVVDDGRGLATATDSPGTGIGLESMRLRAEELGGRCSMSVPEGGGTRLDAWVPARAALPAAVTVEAG